MESIFTSKKSGFSLVEMAMVIGVISIVLGVSVLTGTQYLDAQKETSTKNRLAYIIKVIDIYVKRFGHLPCPADPTLAPSNTSYGDGAGTGANNCTAEAESGSNNVVAGMIPIDQLEIPATMALDGWGRQFTYIVDQDLTFASADAATGYNSSDQGSIIITDVGTPTTLTSTAAVAVISHGQNGYGGRPSKGGSRISATSGGAREDENADGDDTYAIGMRIIDYDDLVFYKMKWQIAQD